MNELTKDNEFNHGAPIFTTNAAGTIVPYPAHAVLGFPGQFANSQQLAGAQEKSRVKAFFKKPCEMYSLAIGVVGAFLSILIEGHAPLDDQASFYMAEVGQVVRGALILAAV